MASRQEEKEARKRERLEQEARERKSAARGKRLQYVIGGLLAVGIVAAVVVVLLAGTGGDDGGDGPTTEASTSATLPEAKILDEQAAAKAAGCLDVEVPNEGATHEDRTFTADDYDSNPPTSGNHTPPPAAAEGIYDNGPPELGPAVHALEHGRIDLQYKPGTDPEVIDQLEAFFNEKQGYHMLLFENQTGMKPQVAATAWDNKLTCDTVKPEMFDALRTFYDAHLDQGPEKVP